MNVHVEALRAVLCDPDGKCCISGSDADRAIVDEALKALAQPAPDADYILPCAVLVYPATMIGKGCKLSTLIDSIRLREGPEPFQSADHEALGKLINPTPAQAPGDGQRARELLAAEYERVGWIGAAERTRNGDGTLGEAVALNAVTAALSAQPRVPNGWALVPKVATEVMQRVGATRFIEYGDDNPILFQDQERAQIAAVWAAMLASAPQREEG
jgi:hypothetical protein